METVIIEKQKIMIFDNTRMINLTDDDGSCSVTDNGESKMITDVLQTLNVI